MIPVTNQISGTGKTSLDWRAAEDRTVLAIAFDIQVSLTPRGLARKPKQGVMNCRIGGAHH